jgi:hypothetical protein
VREARRWRVTPLEREIFVLLYRFSARLRFEEDTADALRDLLARLDAYASQWLENATMARGLAHLILESVQILAALASEPDGHDLARLHAALRAALWGPLSAWVEVRPGRSELVKAGIARELRSTERIPLMWVATMFDALGWLRDHDPESFASVLDETLRHLPQSVESSELLEEALVD